MRNAHTNLLNNDVIESSDSCGCESVCVCVCVCVYVRVCASELSGIE